MSTLRKEIISEQTLLAWLASSAFSTIVYILISAVVVYLTFDCWIMYQHQLAGGSCGPEVNMTFAIGIPVLLGLITGTVLARKISKKSNSKAH